MKAHFLARQLAIDLLPRSRCNVQVAAVFVDSSGEIFSWGWNHEGRDGKGMHAEEHAVSRRHYLKSRLKGARIVVAGLRKNNGKWVCARPCESRPRKGHGVPCFSRLKDLGVHFFEYMTKSGVWKIEDVRDPIEKVTISQLYKEMISG